MDKPMKSIYNCETGETEIREFSPDELKQIAIDVKKDAALQAEAQAKAAARQAIADRLGLTADELKVLLG